jgi:hypothetical protein
MTPQQLHNLNKGAGWYFFIASVTIIAAFVFVHLNGVNDPIPSWLSLMISGAMMLDMWMFITGIDLLNKEYERV